jgi:tripartite-type tricarboxylate transporter receptor subunit TctC
VSNKGEAFMSASSLFRSVFLAALFAPFVAQAQSVEEFYKRNALKIVISSSAGGGYDTYGRVVARHMGRFLPGNPNVVPQNMPGAGGVRAANFLYNQAPKDGSTIAHLSRGAPFEGIMGNRNAQFDVMKFTWLANMNEAATILFAAKNAPVTSYQDLFTKELIVGTAVGDAELFGIAMNNVIGTKLKIITGYPGTAETVLAFERGELQGLAGVDYASMVAQRPTWIADGTLVPIVQYALKPHPKVASSAPTIIALARNDEERAVLEVIFARQAMGRPFLGPPNLPADRAKALEAALMSTAVDADFLADAERLHLEVSATDGAAVRALLTRILSAPTAVIEKARWAVTNRTFVEKVRLLTVKTPLLAIDTAATPSRAILKNGAGQEIHLDIDPNESKITVGGQEAKASVLKSGMTCAFDYLGEGGTALRIACD